MDQFNNSDTSESNVTNKYASFYPSANYFVWDDAGFVWLFSVHMIIVILGVLGNILSLVTLGSYKHRIGLEVMLMYLAAVDLGTLLTTAGWVICVMSPWGRDNLGVTGFIIVFLPYLHFQAMSIYAVVYVSLERHIAICRPLYARHFCTTGKAKLAMFLITGAVVLYYLFKDVQYIYGAVHWGQYPGYKLAVSVFRIGLDPFLLFAIPLPLLIILNAKLVYAIRPSKRAQLTGTKGAQNTLSPALNVAAVVGLFIVTQSTNLAIYIYLFCGGFDIKNNIVFERILYSRNISISLNTSLNFVIYSALSKKFRNALMNLFSTKKQIRSNSMSSTLMTSVHSRSYRERSS